LDPVVLPVDAVDVLAPALPVCAPPSGCGDTSLPPHPSQANPIATVMHPTLKRIMSPSKASDSEG
jgi:hypothetical protein